MLPYRRWPRAAAVVLWVLLPLTARAADDGFGSRRHSQNAALFSRAFYEKNVAYLASDALEGRGTGQEGIDKAAEFIAAWFEKCGVEPAGDKDTYFQNFTLKLSNRIGPGTRLAIGVRGRTSRKPARLNEEYTPFPFSKSASFRGDVVFAGYGIVSDDLEYNDYGDLDVADKVVLILRRSPKYAEFSEGDMSFRAKAVRASARDAAALLVVNPDGDEDGDNLYNFDGSAGAGFGFGGGSYGIPMVHVRRSVADRMLKAGGLGDVTTLQKRIESRQRPVSAALKGVSVRGRVNIEPVESPVRNVAGLIPGEGPQSDEIIVLGAHYDHLGIRHKGEDNFNPEKDISNGADDNASGTALIMTLADAYTRGERPNRSLLLLLFTGEERGLLGSQYFANHPTVDLKKCVAMLNFDMVGRLKDEKLEVGGMRTGDFTEMVDRLAEPYGLAIKDGGGGSGPSDHTSFYNKDIPVLFFFTGLHKQYHRPEDDTPLLNMEGVIRIAKFAADCIDTIDAEAAPPKFSEDTRRARLARQDADNDEDDAQPRPGRVRLGIMPSPDDTEPGVLVAEVSEDSPARRAGVRTGDRIVKLGDSEIETFDDLRSALAKYRRDDKANLTVRRGGEIFVLDVSFSRGEARSAVKKAEPSKQDPHPTVQPPKPKLADIPTEIDRRFEERLALDIEAAKSVYEFQLSDIERFRAEYDLFLGSCDNSDIELETLERLTTEESLSILSKKLEWEACSNSKVEDLPISADLQRMVEADPTIRTLEERVFAAEEALAAAVAKKSTDDVVASAKAMRDFAADRLTAERAQKILACQLERRETAKQSFLEAQERLVSLKDRLIEAKARIHNRDAKCSRLARMIEDRDRLRRNYEALLEQRHAFKIVPRLAELSALIRESLKDRQDDFDVVLRLDPAHAGGPIEVVLRPRALANSPADRKLPGANLPFLPAPSEKNPKKPAKTLAASGKIASNHSDAPSDDSGRETMPGVRLGIMPTYGEATEDGYEISGVVEDGPAAKAGMKDSDRIYQIGDDRIKDIYSYMEALRKYKSGDNVKVVVLRAGKKVTLAIKTAAQKSREAA